MKLTDEDGIDGPFERELARPTRWERATRTAARVGASKHRAPTSRAPLRTVVERRFDRARCTLTLDCGHDVAKKAHEHPFVARTRCRACPSSS